jgi:hypothetical protein
VNCARLGHYCQVAGAAAFLTALGAAAIAAWQVPLSADYPRPQRINCVNNLKQIGLSFKTWALDHQDKYPFNLSTNSGGTMEFCARGGDGFDSNAAMNFQVMSNELSNPLILVCPKDRLKKPASDFQRLQTTNITYLLRSGESLNTQNPTAVLAVCPIHGNILYCDASVKEVKKDWTWPRPAILDLMQYNYRFSAMFEIFLAALIAGCVFLSLGRLLTKPPVRHTKDLS